MQRCQCEISPGCAGLRDGTNTPKSRQALRQMASGMNCDPNPNRPRGSGTNSRMSATTVVNNRGRATCNRDRNPLNADSTCDDYRTWCVRQTQKSNDPSPGNVKYAAEGSLRKQSGVAAPIKLNSYAVLRTCEWQAVRGHECIRSQNVVEWPAGHVGHSVRNPTKVGWQKRKWERAAELTHHRCNDKDEVRVSQWTDGRGKKVEEDGR